MKNNLNNLRLAALPLSLTLISILAGSVVNRVMVVELGLPVTLAGLFIAIPLLIAPVRVWLGHRSDAYPIKGLRREPYIVIGAMMAGIGAAASISLVLRATELFSLIAVAVLLFLILYGVGKNLTDNTFQALIADKFEAGPSRSRAATMYEVVRMIGLIMGAGIVGKALSPYTPEKLTMLVVVLGVMAALLSIFAVFRQEPRGQAETAASEAARSAHFKDDFLKMLWPDPQVRLFFGIITLTLLGTQMQDVLLEPYGGLLFDMDVKATTGLTQFWGVGILIAMLISGLFLLKKFKSNGIFRAGLAIVIAMFPLIIAAGVMESKPLLQLSVIGLGFGTGVSGASLLATMVAFTTPQRAGLLVGLWGMAHQFGRALASLLGGVTVDSMMAITGDNALVAYSTAFTLEAIMLIIAIGLIGKLHIEKAAVLQDG